MAQFQTDWIPFTTASQEASGGSLSWYVSSGPGTISSRLAAEAEDPFYYLVNCGGINNIGNFQTLYSYLLKSTNLSQKVPIGTYILGIEARYKLNGSNDSDSAGHNGVEFVTEYQHKIQLLVGGQPVGNNKSTGALLPESALSYVDFGGQDDLWGLGPLSDVDVNDTNFGVCIQLRFQNNVDGVYSALAQVDVVYLKFHYEQRGMFAAM